MDYTVLEARDVLIAPGGVGIAGRLVADHVAQKLAVPVVGVRTLPLQHYGTVGPCTADDVTWRTTRR